MSILMLLSNNRSEEYSSVEMSDGNKTVRIGRGKSGIINVCVQNASHKAWDGAGRSFPSFDEAEQAYKSAFVKSAIAMAPEFL